MGWIKKIYLRRRRRRRTTIPTRICSGTTQMRTQPWRDCLPVRGRRLYVSRGRSFASRGRGGGGTLRGRFSFGCL